MHTHLKDIYERIPEPPKWFDSIGEGYIPRWCDFAPDETDNIYADEVALVRIDCQNCGHQFKIADSSSRQFGMIKEMLRDCDYDKMTEEEKKAWFEAYPKWPLSDYIMKHGIGFGDPPNVNCCPAGPTMSSDSIRVIEYWRRVDWKWIRVPEFEIRLDEEE